MAVEFKMGNIAAYALISIFHGITLGAIGPAILYFSKVTHQDETYFSFIFFARAIGFVAGASLAKVLQKHMSLHNLLNASILLCAIALIISSIDFGFWNISITMIIIGGSCCIFQIVTMICIFTLFFQEDEEFWVQLSTIFLGIGGLIGPFIALWTEELTLRAIGILLFMCITPLVMLRSPQVKNSEDEEDVLDAKLLQLPGLAELLMCLAIFINIGFIASVPNWMPTYAVKTGKFDDTQANLLASIFWISEILGKVRELLVRGSVQSKTYFLLKLIVICSAIILVLQWFELYKICCYFGSISLGFLLSPLYALFFTAGQQHGYRLSVSAIANLTLASVVSEAIFVAPIGYLMGFFGFQALIYAFVILSLCMIACYAYLNSFLVRNAQEKKGFLQLES